MSMVLYLYGFVPSEVPTPPETLRGIDDGPVDLLPLGTFGAAVTEVDADVYGEGRIEARLKDLGWVGGRGARHETVVTWLADHATIVPARLLTVFSSAEALRARAAERSEVIEALLQRFRHVREWDLKISYDADTLVEHLGAYSDEAAREAAEIEAAPPGRRYLLQRSRQERASGQAAELARRLGRDLLSRLEELATQVTELEVPALGGESRVVYNAALLVHVEQFTALQRVAAEAAGELASHGIDVALTGPWAPYRFMPEVGDD